LGALMNLSGALAVTPAVDRERDEIRAILEVPELASL
jgi:hypothetical protein